MCERVRIIMFFFNMTIIVLNISREHMKSVNGGLLETLETDKYKIIVDDALKWLEKYKVRKGTVKY
jgi:hypothetical protein